MLPGGCTTDGSMMSRRAAYMRRLQIERLKKVKCATACDCEARIFTFRSLQPLHPWRFAAVLEELPTSKLESVVGIAWLSSRPSEQAIVQTSSDGTVTCERGQAWWATQPRETWPAGLAAEIAPLWHEPYGDRQTELRVIAKSCLFCNDLETRLRSAVLTHAEAAGGEKVWEALLDPLLDQEQRVPFGFVPPRFRAKVITKCMPCAPDA